MASVTALVEPGDPDVASDLVEVVLPGTFTNPSEAVNAVLRLALGIDLLQVARDRFRGDWRGVGRTGNAYEHLAAFQDLLVADLHQDSQDAMADWDGEAADAAEQYLRSLIDELQLRGTTMKELADVHRGLAYAMQVAAETMRASFDELERLVLDAAAMGVVSSSGAVVPGLGLLLAAELEERCDAIRAQWAVIEGQAADVDAAVAAAGDRVRRSTETLARWFTSPAGYDHPLADPGGAAGAGPDEPPRRPGESEAPSPDEDPSPDEGSEPAGGAPAGGAGAGEPGVGAGRPAPGESGGGTGGPPGEPGGGTGGPPG